MFIYPTWSSVVKFRGALNFIVVFMPLLLMRYIRPGMIWLLLGNGARVALLFPVGGYLDSCRFVLDVFSSTAENFWTVGGSRSINTWPHLFLPADFSPVVPMVRYLRWFKVMSSWFSGWVSL